MDRRKFLLGIGGTAIGASAIIGSGAFSRVESQRRVKIEVAADPDAYLGLDGCHDSPNSSYTRLDDDGHLEIEMSPDNPTAEGGTGVNSDSQTWFHDVFQICNQGKQKVGIWIQDHDGWPRVNADELGPEYDAYDGDRRVDFYLNGNPADSLIGSENAFPLGVGQCICVGIRTNTKGLREGDQLLADLDDEIVITGDADHLGELTDRVDPDSMSVTGMCSMEIDEQEYFLWRVYNDNPFPVNTTWECVGHDVSGALNVPANVTGGTGDAPWIPGFYFLTEAQCNPIILYANGTEVGRTGIDPGKECEEFEENLITHLVETGKDGVVIPDGTLVLDEDSPGIAYNDDNRDQDRPHINWSINGAQIKLEFVNPHSWTWAFDYRVDGAPAGTDDQWTEDEISQGPLEGEKFGQRYAGVSVAPGETETRILHAEESVEVILRRGPEQEWYIPWITFNVE